MSYGHCKDEANNTENGYLFAETPLTWEVNSKVAINISPKHAWTEVENLWGIGIGANIQLAPDWELITETNIVMNSQRKNNGTIGLRWNATDKITIEAYGTTAPSIIDGNSLIPRSSMG